MDATANRSVEVRLDRFHQGAVTLSADGTIIKANERLMRMLGYSSIDLLGTSLADLVQSGERALVAALTTAARMATCQGEMQLRRADRALVSVLVTMAPLADGRVMCLMTDLAEHKRRAETEERQSKFLGMMAHEFRNILSPIKNASEALRRFPGMPAESLPLLDIIDRQLARMINLVEDLRRINPKE